MTRRSAVAVKIRDDAAEALELPSEKVKVTLKQKARGGISITATSEDRPPLPGLA